MLDKSEAPSGQSPSFESKPLDDDIACVFVDGFGMKALGFNPKFMRWKIRSDME